MNDSINRKGAINAVCTVLYPDADKMNDAKKVLKEMPSAQPEYYDYSDIEPLWKSFAEENDINLTETAKQLKDAMWCGYRKGKADAQPTAASCWGCNCPKMERLKENRNESTR